MASELIEKIKVFYFLTLSFQKEGSANLRNVAPDAVIGVWGGVLEWGAGEWIPGSMWIWPYKILTE